MVCITVCSLCVFYFQNTVRKCWINKSVIYVTDGLFIMCFSNTFINVFIGSVKIKYRKTTNLYLKEKSWEQFLALAWTLTSENGTTLKCPDTVVPSSTLGTDHFYKFSIVTDNDLISIPPSLYYLFFILL